MSLENASNNEPPPIDRLNIYEFVELVCCCLCWFVLGYSLHYKNVSNEREKKMLAYGHWTYFIHRKKPPDPSVRYPICSDKVRFPKKKNSLITGQQCYYVNCKYRHEYVWNLSHQPASQSFKSQAGRRIQMIVLTLVARRMGT